MSQNLPVEQTRHKVQKGVSLGVSAVVVGLLTAFSGVVIELASGFLSDLRHGVCVERIPGDTRPLWHAGFRPYNRMRCCGGALSVDHATQECRAHSIISSTTAKRFAYPLRDVVSFGQEFGAPTAKPHMVPNRHHRQSAGFTSLVALDVKGQHEQHGEVEIDDKKKDNILELYHQSLAAVSGNKERASRIDTLVGQDALSVRTHMSHLFDPDPTEKWAEEDAMGGHAPPEEISPSSNLESAVNEDVVQTQSESAGNLEPFYEWVPWDRALRAKGRASALLISILGSALLALFAALLTRQAIQAKGSGIPEVRAAVVGFAVPKHFCGKTLLAKISGLSLCVGSGLAVGKEGPMIHIGACWGSLLAGSFSRLGGFKTALADTELICVGAAAGVSAAFGAPLAGILFCVEELGTGMAGGLKYSTMIGAFASAVIAALTMKWMDLTRTQRLTLFEVDYKQAWEAWESVVFVLVGVVGGLIGGAFILVNSAIHRRRLRAQGNKDRFCWFLPAYVDRRLQQLLRVPAGADSRVLEIVLLAIFTCCSNFPRTLTRLPQNDAISALFSQCHVDSAANATGHGIHDPVGLCLTQNSPNLSILWLLIAAAAIRFLQTSITFGAMVPAGLFVPSLFMGGCIGRMVGILLKFAGFDVEPGIYAMVGAGAVLAGVSRLTISLVVVLFELTGGLTYIVPFMLAVLTAKWVGDAITDGQSVYDVHAEFSGLAKVEQLEDARLLNITMEDLCGTDVTDKAESGDKDDLPVLWTSCGLVRVCDVAAHCGVAPKGFVVLSTDGSGDVEVLGWADVNRILALLGNLDAGVTAERWCCLSSTGPAVVPVRLAGKLSGKLSCGVVEDLSSAVNLRGVVRIRRDCPILTPLCITHRCPNVNAFVEVDGPHYAPRAMSRDTFLARLASGRVRPLM